MTEKSNTIWFDKNRLTIEISQKHSCAKCDTAFEDNQLAYLCPSCLTLLHGDCTDRGPSPRCPHSECNTNEPLVAVRTTKEKLLSRELLRVLKKDQEYRERESNKDNELLSEIRGVLEQGLPNTEEYLIVRRFYYDGGGIDFTKVEIAGSFPTKGEALQQLQPEQGEVIWARGTFLTMYGKLAQDLLKDRPNDQGQKIQNPETEESEPS